jgi:hypothetical protein
MDLITILEIYSNYPDQILIEAMKIKDSNKWTSFMYRLKGKQIHKILLSINTSPGKFDGFSTSKEAVNFMHDVAKEAIKYVEEYKNKGTSEIA